MKNVIANTKLFLMALSALFILSCSPEDGTDGAIGPQGPAGVDGADGIDGADGQDGAIGPQGPAGENGEDGGVNLMYTDWFNFEDTTSRSDFFYLNKKSYGFYNREFIDNGGFVIVYEGWVYSAALGNTPIRPTNIRSVPRNDINGVHSWEVNYRMESTGIDITIDVQNDPSAYGYTRATWLTDIYHVDNKFFRIVFIPGGQLVSKDLSKKTIQKMTYEEVMQYFGFEH